MIRALCAWVGLPIGTIIQVIFLSCSVSRNLCTSHRHRKPRPLRFFGAQGIKRASARVRPGQQRFRFQVLKEYGAKCAVCSISHSLLLHAAHLCGKAAMGGDDWRNGLPLCATHHLAFDADLFAIDPDTLEIVLAGGVDRNTLGVQGTVATIKGRPHLDALRWRFEQFNKGMSPEPETAASLPIGPV